jgi:hypothetical protein
MSNFDSLLAAAQTVSGPTPVAARGAGAGAGGGEEEGGEDGAGVPQRKSGRRLTATAHHNA